MPCVDFQHIHTAVYKLKLFQKIWYYTRGRKLTFRMWCDYPCIAAIKSNISNSNTKLLNIPILTIIITWPNIQWIPTFVYFLLFWHAARSWFLVVNISISFSQEISF
jgi:hypothetical protein